MGDVDKADSEETEVVRGQSSSSMRAFACKDCEREVRTLRNRLKKLRKSGVKGKQINKLEKEFKERSEKAVYNENWALGLIERGGSRSDRCKDHRLKHRTNIQGMAVAYIDLKTVGEVADRKRPAGPLGGLGPLPDRHTVVPDTSYPLQDVNVGMTDAHIVEMAQLLREKRVLILKAGTGTGKSTFAPYRLMDPPAESFEELRPGSAFGKLTELGQIVITEPRKQATVNVASFVGKTMSGAGGVGPGYPVGYQVSGDRNHDGACQLVYVTDGTMINWLREGRLSQIGTVIVDEAHERSTNIDFIMGYLKRELDRYPHLRVIVTSATFNTAFYQDYFGGPDVANVMDIPAAKSFGYGMPLFPSLDHPAEGEDNVLDLWDDESLPLSATESAESEFLRTHWPHQFAPELGPENVVDDEDKHFEEDVWDTTRKLLDLRFTTKIPSEDWRERMPDEMAKFVIQLARGLDEEGIFGDILGFLPTTRTIEPACDEIRMALGKRYEKNVFPLISSLPKKDQDEALAERKYGDERKIVIATNIAETSLTVEGVRFVVDSGLIAQSEWDPALAQGGVFTKSHSRAGMKQRWGRVGRKAPGWVFPLYTKGQYLDLAEDTPPGSTRENLESLVMTAKMGGIDDVVSFPWPAAFEPTSPEAELDETAVDASGTFRSELERANIALQQGGAVDKAGHPTSFGKELTRFSGLGSSGSALAIMYADRLACVPEVVTILALLEDARLIGNRNLLLDNYEWPDEWRLEAAERHRGLATLCEDDAHLVLLICAAWERSDPSVPPWEPSQRREDWCRQWWLNNEVLIEAAIKRQDVLSNLSPAMKEEVKRFVEPALLDRARGVITRSLRAHTYRRSADMSFTSIASELMASGPAADEPGAPDESQLEETFDSSVEEAESTQPDFVVATLEDETLFPSGADRVIALRRREFRDNKRISNLVTAQPWAASPSCEGDENDLPTGPRDAMRLVVAAADHAKPDSTRTVALSLVESWPIGQRVKIVRDEADHDGVLSPVQEPIPPFRRPKTEDELDAESPNRGKKRRHRRRGRSRTGPDEARIGTRADSDYELSLGSRQGFRDEEDLEREAFIDIDQAVESGHACGHCFPCLNGDESACENPEETRYPGGSEDRLHSWLDKARSGTDVSSPRYELVDEGPQLDGWFEVVGYSFDDNLPVVQLRRDWRPDGFTGNPAQHLDVQPGDLIDVTVGPMVRHHGGPIRSFRRVDGQGRFIMGEASDTRGRVQEQRREIAMSLDRSSQGLLAELVEGSHVTATVVPAKVEGCFSLTLLDLLHQHLAKAAMGHGVERHVLNPAGRNVSRSLLHAALVLQPVDQYGYLSTMLLHQDSTRGVRHFFRFKAHQTKAVKDGENEVTLDPSALTVDDPVLLNIVRDSAELPVGGLNLDVLEEIVAASDRQLVLENVRSGKDNRYDDFEDGGDLLDGEPVRLAGADAILRSASDKPLFRLAAERLTELDDSVGWWNEVWAFWARSHHLRIDKKQQFILGRTTDVFEVPAEVRTAGETPIEEKRKRVALFAERNSVNSILEATVDAVRNTAAIVDLGNGLEGEVPHGELSWGRSSHPSDVVAVGDRLRLLVTEIDEGKGTVRLSAKQLLAHPFKTFVSSANVGDVGPATVVSLQDFGVFVEVAEHVEGLVHVSHLAWARVDKPGDIVSVGDEVLVKILEIDLDQEKLTLSIRETQTHPFDAFVALHTVGDVVVGAVRNLISHGAFVEVADGVDGMVHISELSWVRVNQPSDVVAVGDRVRVKILEVKGKERKLALSIKQLSPHPFDAFVALHTVGDVVVGTVRNLISHGAFVEVADGVDGMVHISQLSWVRVNQPSDVVAVGDRVRVKILEIKGKERKLALSIKQLSPHPFETFADTMMPGAVMNGTVRSIMDFGAFIAVGNGIEGLVHVSEMANRHIGHPSEVVSMGQHVRVRLLSVDRSKRQIKLSLKGVEEAEPVIGGAVVDLRRLRQLGRKDSPVVRVPIAKTPSPAPKRTADGTGKNEAAAIASAASKLGATSSQVTVIDRRAVKKGIFGKVKEPAWVRVREL